MQPTRDIKIYPLDLSEYGQTPGGEPIYRVVWADSRVEKAFADGHAHDLQLYDGHANGKWVLEKWLPGEKAVGVSREKYFDLTRGIGVDMEYPGAGDYYFMAVLADVTPHYVRFLIEFNIGDCANLSPADRARRLSEAMAKDKAAKDKQKDEVLLKALDRKETHA